MMKVLPKFHGPRARLEKPMRAVLAWAGLPASVDELTTKQQPDYPIAITRVRAWLDAAQPDFAQFPCPRCRLPPGIGRLLS